jgi:CheY-like chemotaxis protein
LAFSATGAFGSSWSERRGVLQSNTSATFGTLLNISRERNAAPQVIQPTDPGSPVRIKGGGMSEAPFVLVVEDEYFLQGIVEDALTDGGFATDILSSGEEALTLFKSRQKTYKALVTDVNLKGRISGWEVARQVREIDPTCPVVYMTGATTDIWASQGVPNSVLVEKPFAAAQLVTAISQLLNVGPATT